jgi:hypothetical protein
MKKLFSALLFAALFALTATAQEDAKRFLMVVETTKTTKANLPALRQCVSNLFVTSFSGQMQPGDTLGVWTYSDALHSGDFPMQVCGAEEGYKVLKRLDDFLKRQRYENDANFSQVLPQLAEVVGNSESLTVLVVSDGFEPMAGTPFDAAINKVYLAHRDELKAAHVPFVTVLQARDGKIEHCTINSAAGVISIPPLPPRPKPVVVAPPVAPVAPNTNPPIIVDYSKSNTVATVSPAPMEKTVKSEPTSVPTNTATAPANLVVTAADLKAAADAAATAKKPVSEKGSNNTPLLVLGGILILLLGILAGWFLVRARTPQQSSITQSIERLKK